MHGTPCSLPFHAELHPQQNRGVSVGAAIGGNFVGWNSTLSGGLGGALIGLLVSTMLYLTLSLCIAEMSAHTLKIGGSHTFVGESPLGRLGAYMCGVAELLKIIPTGSVCVFAIASYVGHALASVFGQQKVLEVGIWFVSYGVFTLLNSLGVEMSVNFQVSISVGAAKGRDSVSFFQQRILIILLLLVFCPLLNSPSPFLDLSSPPGGHDHCQHRRARLLLRPLPRLLGLWKIRLA